MDERRERESEGKGEGDGDEEENQRGGGGNCKEIALRWSRRFLKSRRREEVKPCFSLWKAREEFRHGSVWGR